MIYANIIILVLNFIIYRLNRKHKFNDKIYTLPMIDGEGVIIVNKNGKPVVKFERPLK